MRWTCRPLDDEGVIILQIAVMRPDEPCVRAIAVFDLSLNGQPTYGDIFARVWRAPCNA